MKQRVKGGAALLLAVIMLLSIWFCPEVFAADGGETFQSTVNLGFLKNKMDSFALYRHGNAQKSVESSAGLENRIYNEELEKGADLNFDHDYMLVEGAYSQLNIGFTGNDTEYSVTNNIDLPSSVEGVNVSWTSSSFAVDSKGVVTRPEEKSVYATLTARLTCGIYSKTKEFQVYVIKNTYAGYNTDFIKDMDNLENLYTYNQGNLEKLEVYLNEEDKIRFISGTFSDLVVESPEEAVLALYGIKTLMGAKSPAEELRWVSTNKSLYGSAFRFEQVYQGIPIYGSSVIVGTDADGMTCSFQSSFSENINIDTEPALKKEEAAANVKCLGLQAESVDGLYIYMDQSKPVLVWKVSAQDSEHNRYHSLINANTGKEVYRNICNVNELEIGATVGSGNDELSVRRSFPVTYLKLNSATNYMMRDIERNIDVYDMENSADTALRSDPVLMKQENVWSGDEISSYVNVMKAYDFFYNNFGREGFDDRNSKIKVVIRDPGNMGNSFCFEDMLNFGTGGTYIYSGGMAADTVGHEYSHGVVSAVTALGSYYKDEPGAINEGYADIFGYFIEGDDDPEWLHGEDNTSGSRALRNISNPSEFNQPSMIGDSFYYDFSAGTDDHGGVHKNSTIVSHACYLMWKNGISDKTRLADLWYHSLLIGYDRTSTFNSVRRNVLTAAQIMQMTTDELRIIKESFDAVGITGDMPHNIAGTNTLYGKAIAADLDTILGNSVPLPDATVTLVRSDSVSTGDSISDVYRCTTTQRDGSFYFSDIVPGTYKLTISKAAYFNTTQMVTVTGRNRDNYCGIAELTPGIHNGTDWQDK